MATTPQARTTKPRKQVEETYEEWLSRTCDEAEAEANEKGWISNEQSEANFLKHRADFLRKHQKAA